MSEFVAANVTKAMPLQDDPIEFRERVAKASTEKKTMFFLEKLLKLAHDGDFDKIVSLLRNYDFLDMKRRDKGLVLLLDGFDLMYEFDVRDNHVSRGQKEALLALRDTLRAMDYTLTPDYKKGKDRYEEFAGQLISRLNGSTRPTHRTVKADASVSRRKQGKITLRADTKTLDIPGARARSQATQTFAYHHGDVSAVTLSSDGKTVASGDSLGSIFVWNIQSGEPLYEQLRGHKRLISSLAISDTGTLVSGSQDAVIRLWNIDTGELGQVLVAPDIDDSVTKFFEWLETSSFDKDLFVGEKAFATQRTENNAVYDIKISNNIIYAAYQDGWVRSWSIKGGSYLGRQFKAPRAAFSVATADSLFTDNDHWTVIGSEECAIVHCSYSNQSVAIPLEHSHVVRAVKFAPNANVFACSLSGGARDSGVALITIRLTKEGSFAFQKKLLKNPKNEGSINDLTFTPDGRFLIAVDSKGITRVWDWQNHLLRRQFDSGDIVGELAVTVTADGSLALTCGRDGRIKKWPLTDL